MVDTKPVHTLIVDTGPLIKNVPTVSSLLASAQTLVTHPSVLLEIRDADTRSRVETTLRPFLVVREPRAASVKFVQDFARRSGDLEVLSRPDILLLALTYELECERNEGDWRLRRTPGQKGLNGKPPVKDQMEKRKEDKIEPGLLESREPRIQSEEDEPTESDVGTDMENLVNGLIDTHIAESAEPPPPPGNRAETPGHPLPHSLDASADSLPSPDPIVKEDEDDDDDSDSEGWITPSNLSKHQAREADTSSSPSTTEKPIILQSALLTTDHAMQNVALLMNLNLLSSSLTRISQLRTTTQRCHACFFVVRPSDKTTNSTPKQFCPRCGLPTLTKVTCSTSARDGTFQVHLKKNMQWNNRGSRYSIPKPTSGSTSERFAQGGGKGGWGNGLVLAEDQKEYVKAVKEGERARRKEKDLMDDDFWPGLLGGKDNGGGRAGGRIQVGAGRNINSKRRR